MPWETTEKNIRSGHRPVEEFQTETLKTITVSEKDGIQAVVGKPLGKQSMEVQSYLFSLDKGWTLEKPKNGLKSITLQKSMFMRCYRLWLQKKLLRNRSKSVA